MDSAGRFSQALAFDGRDEVPEMSELGETSMMTKCDQSSPAMGIGGAQVAADSGQGVRGCPRRGGQIDATAMNGTDVFAGRRIRRLNLMSNRRPSYFTAILRLHQVYSGNEPRRIFADSHGFRE
jgi:hypothetical protein